MAEPTRFYNKKTGRLTVQRNTSIMEDLADIAKGVTGYKGGADASGIGGRRRSQVIDEFVSGVQAAHDEHRNGAPKQQQ